MDNVTNIPTNPAPRVYLQQAAAFKAFELMTAVKNGVLVLNHAMTPGQRREASRELNLIQRDVDAFMANEPHYFATMHFDPPAEYMRDEEVGGAA